MCLSGSYFSRRRRFKKKEKNTRRRVKLARQTDETGSSLILPESSRLRHWFGEREEDDYKTFTRRHFTLQLIRKRYFSLMDTLHIWLSLSLSLSLSLKHETELVTHNEGRHFQTNTTAPFSHTIWTIMERFPTRNRSSNIVTDGWQFPHHTPSFQMV